MPKTQILTHLLYVDDVLLFGDGTMADWKHMNEIVDIFCGESCINLSSHKSSLSFLCQDQVIIESVSLIFSLQNGKH